MEGIFVFLVTVLAVGFLSYRLGFIRGMRRRVKHQITPIIVNNEEEPTT
jgi:hypothetical protein